MILKTKVKQLRKDLKALGYTLKTESVTDLKVLASIYLNGVWVFGDGVNVYHKETQEKHKDAIKLFNG